MTPSEQPRPDEPRWALLTRPWALALVLFVVTFTVFALSARLEGGSWDHYTANYASWNLVHTGHPWLDTEVVPGLEGDPEAPTWHRQNAEGQTIVKRFPGVIAISLPAYWLAQSSTMTVLPGAMTAAAACALGILMMFLALRTVVPQGRALLACGAIAFTTPLWTVAADAVWPHTVTVLGIGGMAWGAATRRWWLVGIFGGVTLWGRLHAAVIVAVLGLVLGRAYRSPKITVVIGLWSGLFMGLVCAWTRWWSGSWNPLDSYGSNVLDDAITGWEHLTSELTLLASPDRGIFVWTPVLLLLVVPLVKGWGMVPPWARGLLFGALAYTVFQVWIAPATGGDSFYGYRHGIELVVAATPALAITAPLMGTMARRLFAPLLVLQFVACVVGANVDVFVSKELAWKRNAFASALLDSWPAGPIVLLVAYCCLLAGMMRLVRFDTWPMPEVDEAEKRYEPAR